MREIKKILHNYPRDTVLTVGLLWNLIHAAEINERRLRQEEYEFEKEMYNTCLDSNS